MKKFFIFVFFIYSFGAHATNVTVELLNKQNNESMVYSENILLDAIENAIPVGVSCKTCTRTNCSQRAFPPNDRALIFDENVRGISSYVTPS